MTSRRRGGDREPRLRARVRRGSILIFQGRSMRSTPRSISRSLSHARARGVTELTAATGVGPVGQEQPLPILVHVGVRASSLVAMYEDRPGAFANGPGLRGPARAITPPTVADPRRTKQELEGSRQPCERC